MVLRLADFDHDNSDERWEFKIGDIDLTDLAITSLTLKVKPGELNKMEITLLCGEVDVEALLETMDLDVNVRHWNLDGCCEICREEEG